MRQSIFQHSMLTATAFFMWSLVFWTNNQANESISRKVHWLQSCRLTFYESIMPWSWLPEAFKIVWEANTCHYQSSPLICNNELSVVLTFVAACVKNLLKIRKSTSQIPSAVLPSESIITCAFAKSELPEQSIFVAVAIKMATKKDLNTVVSFFC